MADLVDSEVPEDDPTSLEFGERVRALREQSRLTLDQFSKLSGVSRAMVSKVERGEKSPTIGVAKRIAHALGTSLSVLMGDKDNGHASALVRTAERQVFRDPETGFERHLLSPVIVGLPVEVVMHRLPPHQTTGLLPPHPSGTSKHVLALRGAVVVGMGGKEEALSEGDSLYFGADIEHRFDNRTDAWCEYYLVISRSPAVS